MDDGNELDSKERRRATVRASVARHKERLSKMTRLEQAAWKARASLGESFDPYTPEERAEVEKIRRLTAELERAAESLNAKLRDRLAGASAEDPRLAALLGAVVGAESTKLLLPPY